MKTAGRNTSGEAELTKVLVVDDSHVIHSMYRNVLRRYRGCVITDAMNGLEALDVLAHEDRFDLIILDLHMPVMSGLQFLEKIRKENISGQVPVIAVGSEGREAEVGRARELGASGCVVKPFRPEMLYETIDKVLTNKTPLYEVVKSL